VRRVIQHAVRDFRVCEVENLADRQVCLQYSGHQSARSQSGCSSDVLWQRHIDFFQWRAGRPANHDMRTRATGKPTPTREAR
jgi:hypothetical protein